MEDLLSAFDSFFFYFNDKVKREKIVLGIGDGKHLTIQCGTHSGFVDIHLTDERASSPEQKYSTLFEMRRFTLLRLFILADDAMKYFAQKHLRRQKLRLHKFKRHNCIFMKMGGSENTIPAFMEMKKNGRKIKINPRKVLHEFAKYWIDLDDVPYDDSHTYLVYKLKNGGLIKQGFAHRDPQFPLRRSFIYTNQSDMRKFDRQVIIWLFNTLNKLDFPNKDKALRLLGTHIRNDYFHPEHPENKKLNAMKK